MVKLGRGAQQRSPVPPVASIATDPVEHPVRERGHPCDCANPAEHADRHHPEDLAGWQANQPNANESNGQHAAGATPPWRMPQVPVEPAQCGAVVGEEAGARLARPHVTVDCRPGGQRRTVEAGDAGAI